MSTPDDKSEGQDKKRPVIEIGDEYDRDPMLESDTDHPSIGDLPSPRPLAAAIDAPAPKVELTEEAQKPAGDGIRVVADLGSSRPDVDRVVRLLDTVGMLDPLGSELKVKLAPRLKVLDASPGEVVVHEGDPGNAMYLIASGMVSVYRSDRDLGVTVELTKLGSGDNFGEMSLITGDPRSANVAAIEQTRLLVIDTVIFERLVKAVPQVGLKIAARLAHRIDELNQARGVKFDTLEGRSFDERLLQLVPVATIRRLKMVPIEEKRGVVEVATPQPHNRAGLLEIRRLLRGMQVRLIAVSLRDYADFMRAHVEKVESMDTRSRLGFRKRIQERANRIAYDGVTAQATGRGSAVPATQTSSREVSKLIDQMVVEAIDRDASDVIIEPTREALRIRFRVDGRLQDRDGKTGLGLHAPFMSRLKVLAGMDITERRLPQDGRISLKIDKETYALRLATVNTRWGEKAVLRILDSSRLSASMSSARWRCCAA